MCYNAHYNRLMVLGSSINFTFYIHKDFIFLQKGNRYDGQTAVFGQEFQKKLGAQKYFLVRELL